MKHPQRLRALPVVVFCLLLTLSACASVDSEDRATRPDDASSAINCDPTQPPFLGSRILSYPQADGSTRTASVTIPSSRNPREPATVIFAFHGLGGSASAIVRDMQLDLLAERSDVIVVAPQGTLTEFDRSSWGLSGEESELDAEFVDQILSQLREDVCIDPHRLFAMGFSNGSIFAQKYACRQGSAIVAVAGVAGIVKSPVCPGGPVPLVYFHGTGDTVIPIDGGDTIIGPVDGVSESLESWAAMNGCGPAAEPTNFDVQTERHRWTDCPKNGEVRAYITIDGGHRWPGGPIEVLKPAHGTVDSALNATAHSWRFFERAARAQSGGK